MCLPRVSSAESSPAAEPPSKKVKMEETFQLSEQQQQLIREDTANKKLWDEAMGYLKEGPVWIPVVQSRHKHISGSSGSPSPSWKVVRLKSDVVHLSL